MPSGAKKRKAAKKKLQKTHKNGAHPQGNDDARSHDERDSDVEREHSEEGSVENHEEGGKEVSLGDENAAQTAEEVEGEDKSNDVNVEAEEDAAGEPQNGDASVEHKSSSSSSGSDDEEVAVEKEKTEPVVLESSVEVEQHDEESSPPEVVVSEEKTEPVANESEAVSTENSAPSEEVRDVTEESIPVEESVKEVVTSPPESNVETESVPAEQTTVSETIVDELKQKVEELLPSSVDKDQISSTVTGFLENIQTKATQVVERSPVDKDQISSTVTGFLGNIQTKATQVVERGLENLPTPFNGTAKENEALLPQSSGVTTAERNGGSYHVKESEKQKSSDEQPLVSSAPLPVQRTSWMNCCGLLEVFSGGASR